MQDRVTSFKHNFTFCSIHLLKIVFPGRIVNYNQIQDYKTNLRILGKLKQE